MAEDSSRLGKSLQKNNEARVVGVIKAMSTKIGIESSEINLPKPSDTIFPVRICW